MDLIEAGDTTSLIYVHTFHIRLVDLAKVLTFLAVLLGTESLRVCLALRGRRSEQLVHNSNLHNKWRTGKFVQNKM